MRGREGLARRYVAPRRAGTARRHVLDRRPGDTGAGADRPADRQPVRPARRRPRLRRGGRRRRRRRRRGRRLRHARRHGLGHERRGLGDGQGRRSDRRDGEPRRRRRSGSSASTARCSPSQGCWPCRCSCSPRFRRSYVRTLWILLRSAFGYLPDGLHSRRGRDRRHRPPHLDHRRPVRDGHCGASATARTTSSSPSARRTATRSRTTPAARCRSSASSWARSSSRSEPSSSGSRWSFATRRSTSRVFFLPLTFIAMIWPATSRYARRLVEFLIAVILAKFVIVAIIGLASAALTNAISARGAGLRAHDRRRGSARSRRLVALRPAAAHPDDGDRGRERRQPALVDVRCGQSAGISTAGHLHAPGDGSPLAGVSFARLARPRPERPTAAASRAQTDSGLARRRRRTRREPSRAKRGRADRARPPERRAGRPTRRHGRAPRQSAFPAASTRRPALHGRRLRRSHREIARPPDEER